jgi:uncharacterized Zn finger protein
VSWFAFRPYVPVAKRRADAAKLTTKLQKGGRTITPVQIEGRTIARTFWGKAWCDHLESYSDYENRLPRGRTYVRNGSVIDLQITAGKITALVSGSEVYHITITIEKLDPRRWKTVKSQCAGQVGSVLELLQGRLDKSVMTILTNRDKGLFPAPDEIAMKCSCPDWAGLCKHLAAVLYGVGSRLDHQPELLFVLRRVDHLELLDPVAAAGSLAATGARGQKTLEDNELADVFGIDLESTPAAAPSSSVPAAKGDKPVTRRSRPAAEPGPSASAQGSRVPKTKSPKAINQGGIQATTEASSQTGRQQQSAASKRTVAATKSRTKRPSRSKRTKNNV